MTETQQSSTVSFGWVARCSNDGLVEASSGLLPCCSLEVAEALALRCLLNWLTNKHLEQPCVVELDSLPVVQSMNMV